MVGCECAEPRLEAHEELPHPEDRHSRRGELDRKRQTVQAQDDAFEGRDVFGCGVEAWAGALRAVDE